MIGDSRVGKDDCHIPLLGGGTVQTLLQQFPRDMDMHADFLHLACKILRCLQIGIRRKNIGEACLINMLCERFQLCDIKQPYGFINRGFIQTAQCLNQLCGGFLFRKGVIVIHLTGTAQLLVQLTCQLNAKGGKALKAELMAEAIDTGGTDCSCLCQLCAVHMYDLYAVF